VTAMRYFVRAGFPPGLFPSPRLRIQSMLDKQICNGEFTLEVPISQAVGSAIGMFALHLDVPRQGPAPGNPIQGASLCADTLAIEACVNATDVTTAIDCRIGSIIGHE
jgi:hypothetical protein